MAHSLLTAQAEEKRKLRKAALDARAALGAPEGEARAARFARRATALIARLGARCVAGYAPIRGEIGVLPLMEALAETGLCLALPAVAARGAPLVFRRWRPGEALTEGAYGVPVPPPHAKTATPDLLIVPLLAFDRRGGRLGYGGGYYDRTLAALRAKAPVNAVGAAYAFQEHEKLPREETDQPLDWIVTGDETIGPIRP